MAASSTRCISANKSSITDPFLFVPEVIRSISQSVALDKRLSAIVGTFYYSVGEQVRGAETQMVTVVHILLLSSLDWDLSDGHVF